MTFDQKEIRVIEVLSQYKNFLTAASISKEIGVSLKTVYRLIDKINRKSHSHNLIESHVGKGFKINYEEYLLESFQFQSKNGVDVTPNERRNTIFLKLLFKSPNKVKIYDISEEFYISDASVIKDLRIIHEMSEQVNLKLNKKDNQIWIEGIETVIRKTINSIVSSTEKLPLEIKDFSMKFLNKFDQAFIKGKIEELERELRFQISYPYNVNFYLHLCILIARFRSGHLHSERFYLNDNVDTDKNQEYLYFLAGKLMKQISLYLNYELPQMETYYIYQCLISSRIKEREGSSDNVEALEVTNQIVRLVQKTVGLQLFENTLVQDLYSHVVPMLNRLTNNIQIENSLLNDILVEYKDIFHAVNDACQKVLSEHSFPHPSVEEVGFITLYFAKNLEQHSEKYRVVIVCTSGMGTSELLKVKVRKAFNNIEIVDVISRVNFENKIIDDGHVDFILSTVSLEKDTSVPYLIVNALFPAEDKSRVEQLMEELKNEM